jgi:hypothetical protein
LNCENWYWFLERQKSSISPSHAISNEENGHWDEVPFVFLDNHHRNSMDFCVIEEFKMQVLFKRKMQVDYS